jgi:hypothetical protein
MNKILLVVALAVASFTATAQTEGTGKTRFSIGLEAGLPVGDAADAYSFAIGGAVKAEKPVGKSLAATLSAGYTSLSFKEEYKDLFKAIGFDLDPIGVIPVKAGLRYYFNKSFYGAGELGAAFGTDKGSETLFIYSPGVGFSLPVSDKNAVDAGVRYENWSNDGSIGQVGFHVALKF